MAGENQTNPFTSISTQVLTLEQKIDLLLSRPFIAPPVEVLTTAGAAALLGYTEQSIYDLVRAGKIPHCKPNGGRLLFMRQDLLNWVANSRVEAKI